MWVAIRAVVFHLSRIKEKMHTLSKGLRNQEMEGQVLEEVAAKIEDQLGESFPLKIFGSKFCAENSTRQTRVMQTAGRKTNV